jgi:hypothetical protein
MGLQTAKLRRAVAPRRHPVQRVDGIYCAIRDLGRSHSVRRQDGGVRTEWVTTRRVAPATRLGPKATGVRYSRLHAADATCWRRCRVLWGKSRFSRFETKRRR